MANFNPYEFSQAFAQYSQYGDALFPCYSGSQIPFHQTQPSQLASSFRQPEKAPRNKTPVPQEASLEETSSKKSAGQRERWNFNDERVLLQLWADNIEKIESKDSQKAWKDITRALNEKQGLQKSIEQCQRKVKHLKNQYKDKKDWNRRQSGGNLRKSPHYDQIDAVLGCRDIITCSNIEQAGIQQPTTSQHSGSSPEDSPTTGTAEATSSSSSPNTPTTAAKSVVRRRDRKKHPSRMDSDSKEDASIGKAIKKLTTEGDQMARVMERMQASQAQQLQLMTQLLGSFNRYMDSKNPQKELTNKVMNTWTMVSLLFNVI